MTEKTQVSHIGTCTFPLNSSNELVCIYWTSLPIVTYSVTFLSFLFPLDVF